MKFCDKCGSYMKETENGYLCRKCGNVIYADAKMETEVMKKVEHSDSIYIVNPPEDEYVKVSQVCPKCGNDEAFRWFSRISGEHAGIRRERTVVHLRCTKCFHLWTKTS